ncbi:right-handed parallel beta-helix repeat-containing protein [Chryseobacterium camelliae]|uniref:Right-handed parallel beta-helix repeat-containing protein n=1 Tax=Chryseobacterium camelliae TaxID=1265445 RepID=A0ABY7QSN0_9FLAO|nr:right-handed parallel beta-helix repeat-containing protein [Chryseobacterium camelliae]WBV62031.1 right-handed parallel beta-helix repeat-containing protein [Chryseobacterium camelliae]
MGSAIKIQNGNYPGTTNKNIRITNNIINSTKVGDGILIQNTEFPSVYADSIYIFNNTLSNIGQHGINIRDTRHCRIISNKIININHAGLYLRNNSNFIFENNVIENANENGIFDEGTGENIKILDNKFINVGISGIDKNGLSSGIFMELGAGRTIKNNIIIGSSKMQNGIYIPIKKILILCKLP